jgi:hypothetical protein
MTARVARALLIAFALLLLAGCGGQRQLLRAELPSRTDAQADADDHTNRMTAAECAAVRAGTRSVGAAARPAFFQDLKYDLSSSDIVVFRKLRLKVEDANNEFIDFEVLDASGNLAPNVVVQPN